MITEVNFNKLLREIERTHSIAECCPNDCSSLEQQYNLFSKLYPYYLKKGLAEFGSDDKLVQQFFRDAVSVSTRMLFQTTYRVSFEKGGVHETKSFSLQKEKAVMLNFPEIYYPISILINELLIRPFLTEFHEPTLVLLRRLYFNFPNIRKSLHRPILTLLANIRIFGSEDCKKHCAIFLYQLNHPEKNEDLSDLLSQKPEEGSSESSPQ